MTPSPSSSRTTAHDEVVDALDGSAIGLSGHAAFETYSVLTRSPAPVRRDRRSSGRLLRETFPATQHLPTDDAAQLLADAAHLGIGGSAISDALVAAAARSHGLTLVTRDRRAVEISRVLGVAHRMIG